LTPLRRLRHNYRPEFEPAIILQVPGACADALHEEADNMLAHQVNS